MPEGELPVRAQVLVEQHPWVNRANMSTVGDIRRHHIGKESIRYDNVLRSFGELDPLASSLLHARPGPQLMPVDLYRNARSETR